MTQGWPVMQRFIIFCFYWFTGSSLHTYQPITIGYLGLSNHTKTSDDILHIMKDFTFQAASLHIQHRIVNQVSSNQKCKYDVHNQRRERQENVTNQNDFVSSLVEQYNQQHIQLMAR